VELREQVKQAGGKWNRSRKVWEMRYERVAALKLEARIVEEASNTTNQWYSSVTNQAPLLVLYRLNSASARGPTPDAVGWQPCPSPRPGQAAMVHARRA
jgi:hypothetical protein